MSTLQPHPVPNEHAQRSAGACGPRNRAAWTPDTALHASRLLRLGVFLYGLACYALFFGTFLYAFGFVGGVGTPTALDRLPGPDSLPWPAALITNLGLLLLFAVQHSVMARPWFKSWWTRVVPEAAERSTYVLLSSASLLLLFFAWQPLGGVVWQIQSPVLRTAMQVIMAGGWMLVFVSTLLINHFDLFGLRQVWLFLRGRPYVHLPFKTPALYRIVRHPLYLGWFIAFWATPDMTLAHLVFAAVSTLYILAAITWEERDLIELYGQRYLDYRRRVPMLLPRLRREEAVMPSGSSVRRSA